MQVVPASCRYEVLRTKVEITMLKADNLQWVSGGVRAAGEWVDGQWMRNTGGVAAVGQRWGTEAVGELGNSG